MPGFKEALANEVLCTVCPERFLADGNVYQGVSILEIRNGKVAKETDYFAQPFDPPRWRAQWVARMPR